MPRFVGFFFLGLALFVMCTIIIRRGVRERRLRKDRAAMLERRCKCGYLLTALEIPRCPECGCMIGFDKTAEELGISEEEMRAHAQRKKSAQSRP